MSKRIILMLLILVSLLLFSSCGRNKGSEDERADARMEQIVSTIKDKDNEALKSLFSKKALDEADDFVGEVD
jgi:hypothetical protein